MLEESFQKPPFATMLNFLDHVALSCLGVAFLPHLMHERVVEIVCTPIRVTDASSVDNVWTSLARASLKS